MPGSEVSTSGREAVLYSSFVFLIVISRNFGARNVHPPSFIGHFHIVFPVHINCGTAVGVCGIGRDERTTKRKSYNSEDSDCK